MLRMLVCSVLLLGVTWAFVYAVLKLGKVGKWIIGMKQVWFLASLSQNYPMG